MESLLRRTTYSFSEVKMHYMNILARYAGLLLLAFSQCVFAQQSIPSHAIALHGSDVVQLMGKLKGPNDSTRDYVVHVKKGETLSVALDTGSASSMYFNVLQQGSEGALFVGQMQDEQKWQQQMQSEGDYIIRVYINRAAARRGESFRYTLSIAAFSV
jgi:hypothetical protein